MNLPRPSAWVMWVSAPVFPGAERPATSSVYKSGYIAPTFRKERYLSLPCYLVFCFVRYGYL